jgi:quinol monooxygenase YgiN
MYGLIVKMIVVPGQREALIALLLEATSGMPGCITYIVAKDVIEDDAIWITEAWDSKESHDASLSLPSVKHAISLGRPMISSLESMVATTPVGGQGLIAPAG